MRPCHLTTLFKHFENNSKQISLELCTNRQIDIPRVIKKAPPFCSVTWLDNKVSNFKEHPAILLSRKLVENDINVLIHLPGRVYDAQEILEILSIIKDIGVRNILAMQGEKSLGESKKDFPYAFNLVKFIRENFEDYFCIGVTGYPSGHPRSPSLKEDLQYLKQKVDAGADFIITQAVFDIDTFSSFHKHCREIDLNVPIFPGLFIINSYSSLMNMVKFCKLHLPESVTQFIEEHKEDRKVVEEYGISSVVEMMKYLFNSNLFIHCVHIFTMNDLDMVEKVTDRL